jgi:predicted transcriptional regulator
MKTSPCPSLRDLILRDGAAAAAESLGLSTSAVNRYARTDEAPIAVELAAKHLLGPENVVFVSRVPGHHEELVRRFLTSLDLHPVVIE